jgi:integrase
MLKRKFREVSDAEVANSTSNSYSKNTHYATNETVNLLRQFYTQQPATSNQPQFDNLTSDQMNSVLEKFYLSCKTRKDEDYKSTTWKTLRQNLRRALKESHRYDIINDHEFDSGNKVFKNKMRFLKSVGKGYIKHHDDISENDTQLVIKTLNIDNPVELQLLMWFYLQLYFARRGQENLHNQLKDHYEVKIINGMKCIIQAKDELSKNHRENDTEKISGSIIRQLPHQKCPVATFEKYLAKLDPSSNHLWQLPLKNVDDSPKWYHRKAGSNTIRNYMKVISEKCQLSKKYTNHCIRATACTLLAVANYSDINIQSISGHSSLSGLSHYKRITNEQKISMSQSISKIIGLVDLDDLDTKRKPTSDCENSVEILPNALDNTGISNHVPTPLIQHKNCCLSYGIGNEGNTLNSTIESDPLPTNFESVIPLQANNAFVPLPSQSLEQWPMTDEEWSHLMESMYNNDVGDQNTVSTTCGDGKKVEKLAKEGKVAIFQNCTFHNFNF